jgi:2-hydroxy-6-oxonona-2,4-dienedioate hydrolase
MIDRSGAFQYEAVGSGQTQIVLLHGLFGSPKNWRSIMENLADHYRFYALQLPIDPHDDRRHTTFQSISQLTDHVRNFFDVMDLERAVLCGNSLGGQIAIDFCVKHPDQVERLVLAGSAGLFERNITSGKRLRYCRSMIREQALGVFHDSAHVTDEFVEEVYSMLGDRQYRRFLLKVSKATRDRNVLEDLAEVEVPTMIIWGKNDTITPPFVAEQFHDKISRAEIAFIDECGHAPPIEQPAEFARLLHTFLQA